MGHGQHVTCYARGRLGVFWIVGRIEAGDALFRVESEALEGHGRLYLLTFWIVRRIEAWKALLGLEGEALESHGRLLVRLLMGSRAEQSVWS